MQALFVTDLHLTAAVRDAYRFKIFKQLHEEIARRKVSAVWILGDLTDSKDAHQAILVNKIVDNIVSLTKLGVQVNILRGNHDGLDACWPYFLFLNHIPKVTFYSTPKLVPCMDGDILVLPHTRTPNTDWKQYKFQDFKCILLHATVEGSIAENDQRLSGVSSDWFRKINAPIYSGDVHVPQKVGKVTYIGAPFPIRFGDKFNPRMLYLDIRMQETFIDLFNIKRFLTDIREPGELEKLESVPGDQIKVRVKVREADLGKWPQLRKEVLDICERKALIVAGVELVCERSQRSALRAKAVAGIAPLEVLDKYIERHRVTDGVAKIGRELLSGQSHERQKL